MVALAFHDRGVEVTSVGNGEAAVRRLPDLNPDLILADIFMPVRNGYEVCEWVKKDPKFSHIPVILLVGAFDPLDEKEARRVGADGVLKKPFIPPDPLIAMVTAVLEKNSQGSPEPAKAQETAAAPQPLPVAIAAPPAKIEVKPVPEFPEPTPEDASLAYGFGSGRRTLDDGETAEAPPPIATSGEEPEEEFEGASTTKDWRRSAMEFEIPEETSRRPAFSSEEEIEPVSRQSEKFETSAPSPIVAETLSSPETAPASIQIAPISASEAIEPEASEPHFGQTGETAIPEPPAIEGQAIPEPDVTSKATHWMDLMASPAEQTRGDWFTSTFGSRKQIGNKDTPTEPAASTPTVLPWAEAASPELPGATQTIPTQEITEAAAQAEEPFFADEAETNEPAFEVAPAAEAQPTISIGAETQPEVQDEAKAEAQAEVHAKTEVIDEPALNAADNIMEEAAPEPPASILAETSTELVSETADEPTLAKDPNLVEPPAVHVTPEPLLIDESPRGSLTYAAREQETAPLYSFLSAAPLTPAQSEVSEESVATQASSDLPIAEQADSERATGGETLADGFATEEGMEAPSRALGFSASEFEKPARVTPVPIREALAHIPFLNPPPEFHQAEFGSADDATDKSATVDAIAQKVLEKLEPQIRELLSQNALKPLIESLLKSELEKKRR
jgi:CheY-like chemotaxis protein